MSLYLGEDKVTPIIKSGVIPTGTTNITADGTYNVTNYANANVNYGGANAYFTMVAKGTINNGAVTSTTGYSWIFKNITNFNYAVWSALDTFDKSEVVELDCSCITTLNFGLQGWFGWTPLESVDFSSLTTLNNVSDAFVATFVGCSNFPSTFSFPMLNYIGYNSRMFEGCFAETPLTSLSFPALTSNSFGEYAQEFIENESPFYHMIENVTGCTVHFPSNLQSVLGSWRDVLEGFGGTNTTVLFDLPATT